MINLLKNNRWRLCLVLCLYFVSVLAQPWMHSHKDADDTVNQLHVHVSEDFHHDERGHDDNHRTNNECTSTIQENITESPIQSTANHLLLNSSNLVKYPPAQSKSWKVLISFPACTQDLLRRDSEAKAIAVTNTIENPPRLSSILITSLTDLSPPRA